MPTNSCKMRKNGPTLLRLPASDGGVAGVALYSGARYGGEYEPLMTRLKERRSIAAHGPTRAGALKLCQAVGVPDLLVTPVGIAGNRSYLVL